MSRFASIWFPYLLTEYVVRKKPEFREASFVLASRERGRMLVKAVSHLAAQKGIFSGMVVADCKALFPELEVIEAEPGRAEKVLQALAEWCISYTPITAVDMPEGLLLDITGCTLYQGGETVYIESIKAKLNNFGYTVRVGVADTIGAAWAIARFGKATEIVNPGSQHAALRTLPPAALRLEPEVLTRLKKLGLEHIDSFINMPSTVLRRRFGASLPFRIGQALGTEIEILVPIKQVELHQEKLFSLEPIPSAKGIMIALQKLLDAMCLRFEAEGLGLRHAVFRAYRVDGDIQQIEIGTGYPSRNPIHLFKLFENKITLLQPDLGFETFMLDAPKVESITDEQAAMWSVLSQNDKKVAELLDRVSAKAGSGAVSRYLPDEHYWPERSVKQASPLWEKAIATWRTEWPRPIHLLSKPEPVEVTAVLPDYPPMLFRYKGKLHHVAKSDGPERIEQEWWQSDGLYRDYYCIEDENGARYWLFRSGSYEGGRPEWFIHGFFA